MLVETAPGTVIDRLTILELKLEKIADPAKREPVRLEYEMLSASFAAAVPFPGIVPLRTALKEVNAALWQVENDLRDCERTKDFGSRFIELARSIYRHNDRRSALKRQIDEAAGSVLTDVKSYPPYE
jgi:hypothetical protein